MKSAHHWMSVSALTQRMVTDMATRRAFLAGLAAATLPRLSWADAGNPAYLAAAKLPDDAYALHGLSAAGETLFTIPLPARGHAACAHPTRAQAVAFARRPGTYALVLDAFTGSIAHRLTPPAGHQFNGHGAYAADGSVLFTSEQVADGSAGRLGMWDTQTYTRIGDIATGGIGPHDVRLLPGGGLVVANGGIDTDPTDRTKLNITTMQPNLAYLDAGGRLIDIVMLPPDLHQNSIRHLALFGGGVAFALQWEGDTAETPPLLGIHRAGSSPSLHALPETDAPAMKNYAGSIAVSGDMVALTSAPGGVVARFTLDGTPLPLTRRTDASGIAPHADGFLLSDGTGNVSLLSPTGVQPLTTQPLAWDNHLVALL
jgi:uncharacterized protein